MTRQASAPLSTKARAGAMLTLTSHDKKWGGAGLAMKHGQEVRAAGGAESRSRPRIMDLVVVHVLLERKKQNLVLVLLEGTTGAVAGRRWWKVDELDLRTAGQARGPNPPVGGKTWPWSGSDAGGRAPEPPQVNKAASEGRVPAHRPPLQLYTAEETTTRSEGKKEPLFCGQILLRIFSIL